MGYFRKLISGFLAATFLLWSVQSQAAITYTVSNFVGPYSIGGKSKLSTATLNLAGTYDTGGFSLNARSFGMKHLERVVIEPEDGFQFFWDESTGNVISRNSAPEFDADYQMAVAPTVALTHNADCATNLLANPLFAIEASGQSSNNVAVLESTNNGNADVLGETANGTVGGVAASARFFVNDNDTPGGVQIYIAEDTSDRLEFVSPTATNATLIWPFEAVTGAPPGFAIAVTVHHAADAATGKALSFDDNGAADAQLCFNDAGATGGTIPSGDIAVVGPSYTINAATGGSGMAETANGESLADVDQVNVIVIGW